MEEAHVFPLKCEPYHPAYELKEHEPNVVAFGTGGELSSFSSGPKPKLIGTKLQREEFMFGRVEKNGDGSLATSRLPTGRDSA
jgi:hypothetical protein